MKRKNGSPCFWVLLLFLVLAFSTLQPAGAAQGSELTILFTHDLHDHLLPYTLYKGDEITSLGGFAYLQSAIKLEREKDPDLLLVDAGDFSMGTLFQTIYSSHAPQLRLMGLMGYDVTTIGNHEFDFRARGLANTLSAALKSGDPLPQIVASNITFPYDENDLLTPSLQLLHDSMAAYPVKDYIILERKGVRIGIFGLMGEEAELCSPMAEVEFTDAIDSARRVTAILKNEENADLVICLSHSGTGGKSPKTEDEILAKQVPQIDVIISGHSHTELHKPIVAGNTIIGSCGAYSQNLGILKIEREASGAWHLKDYTLKPIDSSLPADEEIARKIEGYKEIIQEEYLDQFSLGFDEIITQAPFNFTSTYDFGKTHREEPLGNLIADAYIHAIKIVEGDDYEPITAAIVPNGIIRGSFVEGPITTADVFIVSSLGIGADGTPGYPLVSIYLTGKELKTLCEMEASIGPLMPAAQLFMAGLNYTFNPKRLILNKVTETKIQDPDGTLQKIDDRRLYRVVAGLHSGQMLPAVKEKSFGLLSLVPRDKEGHPIEDLEDYIVIDHSIPGGRELKEWYALAQYLGSFEKIDGIPTISEYYSQAQGRKNLDTSKDLYSLIKKPNKYSLTVYGVTVATCTGIGILIYKLIKNQAQETGFIFKSHPERMAFSSVGNFSSVSGINYSFAS